MSERKVIPIEEKILRMEPWQRNIFHTNYALSQEIEQLGRVDQSETGVQVTRVRNRIINFTRAAKEGYRINKIPGTFPEHRLVHYVQDGPRYYYSLWENELRRIATPLRRFRLLGEDFTKSDIVSPQTWIRDDNLRDKVVQNLRGLVPYEIIAIAK